MNMHISTLDTDEWVKLLIKYNKPVPRYTSFPTAAQFQADFKVAKLKTHLTTLNKQQPISLYIHIPYCHSLCHYCGCHTKIVHSEAPITSYIRSLLQEIKLFAEQMSDQLPVSRIHFGGGSPNYAPVSDLTRLLETLSDHFAISSTTELHIECDPRLLDPIKIRAYASLGFTHISLGVQDFNPDVQQAINRTQPYDLIARHIENIYQSGIRSCNFDIMIGLPKQTTSSIKKTAEQVLQLHPSSIAVFPYAHVPWMKKHQKLMEKFDLPDTISRFQMSQLIADQLTHAGYCPIGIDHFALKEEGLWQAQEQGCLHRNFQGYTDDQANVLIGFGLSAISQFPDMYVQNTTSASIYHQMIAKSELPVVKGLCLSKEDQRRRDLIENIMCYFKIDFEDFPDIHLPDDKLLPLYQDGIIDMTQKRLQITKKGKPLTRIVASCFDPYFQQEARRHSSAV